MRNVNSFSTYLINLDRAPDRLKFMDAQLRRLGIGYQRIAAVDRLTLDASVPEFDTKGYRTLHGRGFHDGEIACYLSHIACLRAFLASPAEHALILEDDGRLPDDLAAIVRAAIAEADEWDILRLSTVNSGIRVPYRKIDATRSLAIALTREKGAGGYVVNRRCAEVFLKRLLPIRVAWDIAFDIEYLMGLRSVFVVPVPIDQNTGMETQIQFTAERVKLSPTRYLTVFPYRAYLETNRFVRRGLRLLRKKINRRKS
ncbi:glycosyltransferase family 25 protein [Hoeflea sp. YIM 152468]|uniref:glycosyltransferase family 25 protein n=1 Tax=Hoeflea sp. YIM 152468 TaxID=3031759 RepID=UPI0023DB22E7|nr:glycosyltransferase family 25 protein [Hoeflea sp. YIM 152468]MDF1608324.1 glycosyltransferase family 25 protein [Hoeflea sp. YIM 152468]